jgi:hypothetical protein
LYILFYSFVVNTNPAFVHYPKKSIHMAAIVWGHNSFLLKTVEPIEIGLIGAEYNNIKFELRQEYGHLYWIPFIPLKKYWAVRRADNKLYHCTPELENGLKERFPKRTSVFAWTGPLLILAGFGIAEISSKISHAQYEKEYATQFVVEANDLGTKVENVKENDFLLIATKDQGSSSFDNQKIPLKVMRIKPDEILLGMYGQSFSALQKASADEEILTIANNTKIGDSFWVAKKVLQAAFPKSVDEKNAFAGVEWKGLYTNGTCKIEDVKSIYGPYPDRMPNVDAEDGKYFEIINKGMDAHADSIVSETEGVKWKLSEKKAFKNGDIVAVKADGKGEAYLYLSDKAKHVYRFLVSNNTDNYSPFAITRSEKSE